VLKRCLLIFSDPIFDFKVDPEAELCRRRPAFAKVISAGQQGHR
jgi:hypothetical protein